MSKTSKPSYIDLNVPSIPTITSACPQDFITISQAKSHKEIKEMLDTVYARTDYSMPDIISKLVKHDYNTTNVMNEWEKEKEKELETQMNKTK